MNEYLTTQQEENFLTLSFDTKALAFREKKSICRIQISAYKGMKALKSIEDQYSKFRIVMASLLIKIYLEFTPEHQQRLNKLKDIIYSSSLKSIEDKRGIDGKHILKSIAENLAGLQVGVEAESEIIRLFNHVPFFDETVMKAFAQHCPDLMWSDLAIKDWMMSHLDIDLDWNCDSNVINESSRNLSLIGITQKNHSGHKLSQENQNFIEYMRYSIQDQSLLDHHDQSNFLPRLVSQLIPLTPDDRSTNRQEEPPNYMLMSIQSLSPTVKVFDSTGRNKDRTNNPLDASDEVCSFNVINCEMKKQGSKKKPVSEGNDQRVIRIRRRKQNMGDNNSGFWKYLCCGFGDS